MEDVARAEFLKLEEGDKENLKMWKEFRELSLKEFDKIYSVKKVMHIQLFKSRLFHGVVILQVFH